MEEAHISSLNNLHFTEIVSISGNGSLNVNQKNLRGTSKDVSSLATDTPVCIFGIKTGRNTKEELVLTSLLAECVMNCGTAVGESVIDAGTSSGNLPADKPVPISGHHSINGDRAPIQNRNISICRPLFWVTEELESPGMVVTIMKIPYNDDHSDTGYSCELEEFLALTCSKILELERTGNDKIQLKLLEPYLLDSPKTDVIQEEVRLEKICNTCVHTILSVDNNSAVIRKDTITKLLKKIILGSERKTVIINHTKRTLTLTSLCELLTAAANVARSHHEERAKARAEMNSLVNSSKVEITATFPYIVKDWIENHLTTAVDPDKNYIQSRVMKGVLGRCQGSVHPCLLKEFTSCLDSYYNISCQPMWTDFENFAVTLNATLQVQFATQGYVSAEKLEATRQNACRNSNIRPGDFISDLKKLAGEKLVALYKAKSDSVLEAAKERFLQDAVKLGETYKEEMALHLSEKPYDILALEVVHYSLMEKMEGEIKRGFRQSQPPRKVTPLENGSLPHSQMIPLPPLPPLIFHLQRSKIVMGIDMEDVNDRSKIKFVHVSDASAVIMKPDGTFAYGQKALNLRDSPGNEGEVWWHMEDFFRHNNSSWRKRIRLLGTECRVSTEFFLAILLRTYKVGIENRLGGPSDTAILAIPYWLTSTQRSRVKNAAEIAGFVKVFLVNDASAAAYNLVLDNDMRQGRQEEILVVSDKLGGMDAFVYSYNSNEKKIRMIAHSSKYREESTFIRNLKMEVSQLMDYLFPHQGPQQQTDWNKIGDTLWSTCSHALEKAKVELGQQNVKVYETLIILDQEGSKWNTRLTAVVRNFGRKASGIDESGAVLNGLKALRGNPEKIGEVIQDKLAWDVLRLTFAGEAKFIREGEDLPSKVRRYSTFLFMGCNYAKIFQNVRGKEHLIGELKVRGVGCTEKLEPQFNVTNEGIVTLDSVLIRCNNGEKRFLTNEQIQWKTPNLTPEEIQEQADILSLLITAPSLQSKS